MDKDMLLDFEKPVYEIETRIRELEERRSQGETAVETEIKDMQKKFDAAKQDLYTNLAPWQRVQLARHPKRPYLSDYIPRIFEDFMELHGDRGFADDHALMGGMAYLDGTPVMVIGHRKGRTLQES